MSLPHLFGPFMGIADYGTYCAAILLFLALPGPGTFALLTSTAKGGFRAGAAATLGADHLATMAESLEAVLRANATPDSDDVHASMEAIDLELIALAAALSPPT